MGTSIQMFRGKSVPLNDLDLLVIAGFMIQVVEELRRFENLSTTAARWREAIRLYGPGVIDLDLEALLATPEKNEQFQKLLSEVKSRLQAHGEVVPSHVLAKLVQAPGVTFKDFPVSFAVRAVEQLEELVGGYDPE